MFYLVGEIFIWLFLAFLLGLLVGWWIWGCCKKVAAPALPAVLANKPAGTPDDLRLLKGVGEKLSALLISHGVTSFKQIANWTEADIAEVDAKLGQFKGRIKSDKWVEQAGLLAAGKHEEFNQRFGELGSELK